MPRLNCFTDVVMVGSSSLESYHKERHDYVDTSSDGSAGVTVSDNSSQFLEDVFSIKAGGNSRGDIQSLLEKYDMVTLAVGVT